MLSPRNLIIIFFVLFPNVRAHYRFAFHGEQEKSQIIKYFGHFYRMKPEKKKMKLELIDTHAHLDFPEFFDSIPDTLERADEAGVQTVVTIGIDLESSRKAAALAEKFDRIYAVAGIHPHDSFAPDESSLKELEDILQRDRVVAVGETGLDYYRNKKPHPVQIDCMRRQIELACKVRMPVVFHIRDAWEDFFRLIPEYVSSLPQSVMHCFSGDWKIARTCLKMGFYLSVPGVVTFAKARDLQDVVARAPLDRLLVETDAPYLAPVPYRGKTNEPAFVLHTARKISELRNEPLEKIAEYTTRNAKTVFRI
jgi:TatD DNase family protein